MAPEFLILRGDAVTVRCRSLLKVLWALWHWFFSTWTTWGRDSWFLTRSFENWLKSDLILRPHMMMNMNAERMSLTMSCTDAELWCWRLSEPYLITMKADQCLSWFIEHLVCRESQRTMWLWVLDCWAPQLLMLITWCWSLLIWQWNLILMVLLILSLKLLAMNLMTLMPVDQDLQDEVIWPLLQRPWCCA